MYTVFVVTRLAARPAAYGDHPEVVNVFRNEDSASEFCKRMNTFVKNGYYYQYDPYEYNMI